MTETRETVTFVASDGATWSPSYVIGMDGFGIAPFKIYSQGVPYYDGAIYQDQQMQPRVLLIQFAIVATTRADLYAQRASAVATLSPAKGPGTLQFAIPGLGTRQLTCVVDEGPKFNSAGRIGILGLKDSARFVAHDPAWYDPAPVTLQFVGNGGIGITFPITFPISFGNTGLQGSQTAANAGDLLTYPIITVTGPGTGLVITIPDPTNASALLVCDFGDLTLSAGDTLTIDHRPGHQAATLVTSGGVSSNVLGQRSVDSYFWGFPAGSTTVAVSLTGTTTASSITLQWYNRYSGV